MEFDREKHIAYFKRCIAGLPHHYTSLDVNRMTLLYFCVGGLDILGALSEIADQKQDIIDWVYGMQVVPVDMNDPNIQNCGFRGSSSNGFKFHNQKCLFSESPIHHENKAHITMTHTALAILKILGDDYSRVNKQAIVTALSHLQNSDGSFKATAGDSESDMRFLYCASVISAFLNDWSGVDKSRATDFILKSQGYDSGFGQGPSQESHGGSTYCAVASLFLMDQLDKVPGREQLISWMLNKQVGGFCGRPHKDQDTCYSFWIGASLALVNAIQYMDPVVSKDFSLSCQGTTGGFSKCIDAYPDPLHSYMALSGMCLTGVFDFLPKLNPALGLTLRAAGDNVYNK